MTAEPGKSRWPVWVSRVLLGLAVLASAAVLGIAVLVVYLAVAGYSGNGLQPVAFPVVLILFIVAEIPAVLICALLWLGYRVASDRSNGGPGWRRRPGELASTAAPDAHVHGGSHFVLAGCNR